MITDDFTAQRYLLHANEGQTWVREAQYERQRSLREHHIEFLRYLRVTNRLRPGTPVDFAVYGNRRIFINGNHTVHAIIRSEMPTWITLTEYKVKSMHEVDELYNTFDRQMPRTPRDMLRAFGFAEYASLNQRECEVLLSAMRPLLSGFVYFAPRANKTLGYLRDNERLYIAALQWVNEARMFYDDIGGVPRPWHDFLIRQPLLAIALIQYRFETGLAETFWRWVAKEDHPEPSHPTRRLARWLSGEAQKTRTSAQEFAYMTAMAWNAVKTERLLRSFNMPALDVPLALEGTPYTRSTVRRYINEQWELQDNPVSYDEPMMRRQRHEEKNTDAAAD